MTWAELETGSSSAAPWIHARIMILNNDMMKIPQNYNLALND
jgi:hypothetical protein